jgi:CMP/dCMP kinase
LVVVSTRLRPVIAIDGPAGAGKSTLAKRLADALEFVLVDTGAIYRALALAASRAGIDFGSGAELGELARKMVEGNELVFRAKRSAPTEVIFAGEDVSQAIRSPEIGMGASRVSAHPEVRLALLDLQRQLGRDGGVVLEGRDIGTVVFPDAELKFFLTARPEIRAHRRYDELVAKGSHVSFEETLADVKKRDANDTNRPVAPLRMASDAVLIDSSEKNVEEAVALMLEHVQAHLHGARGQR